MDKKPSGQHPTGSLQANGPLSPPLTPALNVNGNSLGILDDGNASTTNGSFHNARPVSPDPSLFNASMNPSPSSSPRSRHASTFTTQDTTPASSQRSTSPTYKLRDDDASPPPPFRPRPSAQPKMRHYSDGREEAQAFPRLSKPVELLRTSYDVVVIGSGYGGGVAASRMARTGESVCLLERGKEKWPGEYPSGTLDSFKELHCSGVLAPGALKGKMVEGGDPTGLFHLVLGRGQSAVVANGE
jgi:hypothetical protein